MQTPIAQSAALTIAANTVLRGHDLGDFWPEATVFTFCRSVVFVAAEARPYAGDPLAWIDALKADGVRAVRLHHVARNSSEFADRLGVGFVGGGGRWVIETAHATSADLWEASWDVAHRDAPDRKIWRVAYQRIATRVRPFDGPPADLAPIKAELDAALGAVLAFAERHKLEPFDQSFAKARAALVAEEPLASVFHADLDPGGLLPKAARQLLAAAQAGWVFGGMGSWNDTGVDDRDQQVYDAVSQRLYAGLIAAILAAANASA